MLFIYNISAASSRPSSSLSQQSTTSVASSVSVRHRPSSAPRRQRPASIAITGVTHDLTRSLIDNKKGETTKPPLPKTRKSLSKPDKPGGRNKSSPVDSAPKSLVSPVSPTVSIENHVNDIKTAEKREAAVEDKKNEVQLIQIDNNDPEIEEVKVAEKQNAVATVQDNKTTESLQKEGKG